MTTYLFVTNGEIYDAAGVGPSRGATWSCSKNAREGDRALVYLVGKGIEFEWALASNATKDPEWGFICDVVLADRFQPPVTIQELRERFERDRWAPPHVNFRGMRSIRVPDEVAEEIRSLRSSQA